MRRIERAGRSLPSPECTLRGQGGVVSDGVGEGGARTKRGEGARGAQPWVASVHLVKKHNLNVRFLGSRWQRVASEVAYCRFP